MAAPIIPLHSVPTADSAANDYSNDAIGSKLDAASETAGQSSLIGLSRAAIARLAGLSSSLAPATVLGTLADVGSEAVGAATVVALLRATIARLATQGNVALATAASVTPPAKDSVLNTTTGEVVGTKLDRHNSNSIYGITHTIEEHIHSYQRVLPDLGNAVTATANAVAWQYGAASASLGTPADDFDIHWVQITANNNDEYQYQVLVGGVVVGEGAFERINVQTRSFDQSFEMAIAAPGAITVKLASRAGGSTATFKVHYHLY